MRHCTIATGCKKPDKPCCTDCPDKACLARCQNSPSRCKCWEDGPRRKARGHKIGTLPVVYLHEKGLTQMEIAKQLGCSRHTVGNILREMGVGRFG